MSCMVLDTGKNYNLFESMCPCKISMQEYTSEGGRERKREGER